MVSQGDIYKISTDEYECKIEIISVLGQRVYYDVISDDSDLKSEIVYYKVDDIEESDSINIV